MVLLQSGNKSAVRILELIRALGYGRINFCNNIAAVIMIIAAEYYAIPVKRSSRLSHRTDNSLPSTYRLHFCEQKEMH